MANFLIEVKSEYCRMNVQVVYCQLLVLNWAYTALCLCVLSFRHPWGISGRSLATLKLPPCQIRWWLAVVRISTVRRSNISCRAGDCRKGSGPLRPAAGRTGGRRRWRSRGMTIVSRHWRVGVGYRPARRLRLAGELTAWRSDVVSAIRRTLLYDSVLLPAARPPTLQLKFQWRRQREARETFPRLLDLTSYLAQF